MHPGPVPCADHTHILRRVPEVWLDGAREAVWVPRVSRECVIRHLTFHTVRECRSAEPNSSISYPCIACKRPGDVCIQLVDTADDILDLLVVDFYANLLMYECTLSYYSLRL
jgi:hypothetical protein